MTSQHPPTADSGKRGDKPAPIKPWTPPPLTPPNPDGTGGRYIGG